MTCFAQWLIIWYPTKIRTQNPLTQAACIIFLWAIIFFKVVNSESHKGQRYIAGGAWFYFAWWWWRWLMFLWWLVIVEDLMHTFREINEMGVDTFHISIFCMEPPLISSNFSLIWFRHCIELEINVIHLFFFCVFHFFYIIIQ